MISYLRDQKAFHSLLPSLRRGRMASCYLIEGDGAETTRSFARLLAAALFCQAGEEKRPCLDCPACRKVLSGQHVDCHELRSAEEGKKISLDEVRRFLQEGYVLPSEGDWRVFILEDCQNLRVDAQNTLLKSLEEARPNTVFFLLTSDVTRLLPTVRSRAVRLRLEPLAPQAVREILMRDGVKGDALEEAIRLASGSLPKAREIALDDAYRKTHKVVTDYFRELLEGAGFTRLCLVVPPGSLDRKELSLFLSQMKSALRDVLCALYCPEAPLAFFADFALPRHLADVIHPKNAWDLFSLIEELLFSAERNVNPYSAMCALHEKALGLTEQSA